jgi:hypothetical protein
MIIRQSGVSTFFLLYDWMGIYVKFEFFGVCLKSNMKLDSVRFRHINSFYSNKHIKLSDSYQMSSKLSPIYSRRFYHILLTIIQK